MSPPIMPPTIGATQKSQGFFSRSRICIESAGWVTARASAEVPVIGECREDISTVSR